MAPGVQLRVHSDDQHRDDSGQVRRVLLTSTPREAVPPDVPLRKARLRLLMLNVGLRTPRVVSARLGLRFRLETWVRMLVEERVRTTYNASTPFA